MVDKRGLGLKRYWERHNFEGKISLLEDKIAELEAVIEGHKRLARSRSRLIVNFEEGTWLA